MTDYKVNKTDAEWRAQLDPMDYQVTRQAATERAFTGRFWDHFEDGAYKCICCSAKLFESDTKFDAGCGWPSYWDSVEAGIIERVVDRTHGMIRVEVRCQNCGAHLGHVFDDGPQPTGERYCINSAALDFVPRDK
jgi:peptide-methionine (R)-S-oxide reductase